MKQGRTINALAEEISRQMSAKRDYVAPRSKMRMELREKAQPVLTLANGNGGYEFGVRPMGHEQLAAKLSIPKAYYDRMLGGAQGLLVGNVNHWLEHGDGDKAMMVRTLDGQARAFLSDRYRALDHSDLAEAILPTLQEQELYIVSCEITERRLYIKAFDKRIEREIELKGSDPAHTFIKTDVVYPAITISNSEVGCGSLSVAAGLFTGGCTNFASFSDSRMRKYHIGGRLTGNDELSAMLSDTTKRLTDAAIWAQTRDVVMAAFQLARFEELVGRLQQTTEQKIDGDVVEVISRTGKRFGFSEHEGKSVLKHLVEGGSLTQYGLFNAVTRAAEDLEDYDRATQFERFGGEIVELPANEWKHLASVSN